MNEHDMNRFNGGEAVSPIQGEQDRLESILGRLPQPYRAVTDEFVDEHRDTLDELKAHFAGRNIPLFRVIIGDDEQYSVICRVPSRQIVETAIAKSQKKSQPGMDTDLGLCRKILVYPSVEELYRWVNEEHALGVPGAIANEAMKKVHISTEARSGEL